MDLRAEPWGAKSLPLKEKIRFMATEEYEHTSEPMGYDGMNPKVLKEVTDAVTKTLSMIFEKSQQSGEDPGDWDMGNIVLILKKGRKEDCGKCQPVSLTSVPGKVMGQTLPKSVLRHVENWRLIQDCQHSFTKGKSHQPSGLL